MMAEPIHVSVVLPTFNERDNIGPLIEALLAHLADVPTEIVVVDDDSPDGTWEVVAGMAEGDERVRLLHRTEERGLTSALAAGIGQGRGEIVVWMDCDFSMPPEVVPALVEAVDQGYDLALGSRYVRGGRDVGHSWTGRAFSRTINFFASLLLGWQVRDYTSGFIAARRRIFDQINLQGDYGEYCIDLLHRARRLGFRLKEIPYDCVPRERGESKTAANAWGYVRRGTKYVTTILQLWLRPPPKSATPPSV
jgi:dolichol-phosphate mannosyltransferase